MGIVILMFGIIFVNGCNTEKPAVFNPNDNLDLENIFFDDFNEGIDINKWEIANTKWGTTNNGVVADNVSYTSDGVVILQANGDYYDGPIKGHNSTSGKRTGAALISNQALGPGRFEVRMKAMPRFGATTAFWTFYYDDKKGINHEIDIELNVNNDFRSVWTTNWTTLNDSDHREIMSDVVHNDGAYHTYKFEWHTNPNRIDYYVDEVLIHTSESNIPDHAGRLWIGHWFPDGWAGTPDFESDYLFVDWIKHTPYKDNPYVKTEGGMSQFPQFYDKAPVKTPVNNLISNNGFEGDVAAWRKTVDSKVEIIGNMGVNNSSAIHVPKDEITYQFITGLDDTFEVTIVAYVKLEHMSDKGYILLEARPLETALIDSFMVEFSKNDPGFILNEYYLKTQTFKLPIGTKRIELSLIGSGGGGIYFDELYFNIASKTYASYLNQYN